MDFNKLFHVLVVQGALIAGCDADTEDEPAPDGPQDSAVTADPGGSDTGASDGAGTATSASSTTGDGSETQGGGTSSEDETASGGSSGGDDGSSSADGGDGTTADDGGSESDSAGAECSEAPDPSDPCGCPCCWVSDCVNTDACCSGWSECAP